MKILMLITQLGYGGAESAFVRLARELARRNQVELAVFTPGYGVSDYSDVPLATDAPLNVLDNRAPRGRLSRWVHRWRELRRLKAGFGADVTISFLTGPNLLNVLARGPGRTIVSLRGSRRFDAHSRPLTRWLYRWLVDPITHWLADSVVCVSQGLALEAGGRRARSGKSKFVAISGYVDAERLIALADAPTETELDSLRGQPVVVAAGRLSREKGFQHLIPLFAEARKTVPGAKLLLIGDGPMRSELERLTETNGLTHGSVTQSDRDVLFAGYRTEPSRYFQIARLFVLSSASEGFPNILVEALAAGVPVAAADVPWGVREVMGVGADPLNRPFPRNEAMETPYGMLMPRIDDPRHRRQWVSALVEHLDRPSGPAEGAEQRRARVRSLDCSLAAAEWEALIGRLSQHCPATADAALQRSAR